MNICVSIVSHGQAVLVRKLLADLRHYSPDVQIILTSNVPESEDISDFQSRSLIYVENKTPKGFGANHNSAFSMSSAEYFCVLNPDIRLCADPFRPLLKTLEKRSSKIGLIAPVIMNSSGEYERNGREFPSVLSLVTKVIDRNVVSLPETSSSFLEVDWVAGMFMLFRASAFRSIQGFDERYFLYYEDVDVCRRLGSAGYEIGIATKVCAVHDAQRDSHKKLKYFRWHAASLMRYFLTHEYGIIQPK